MDPVVLNNLYWLDVVFLVRLFCIVSIATIVAARILPASRSRFLNYGARGQPTSSASKQDDHCGKDGATELLDWLASIDVPHSWFTHFYILSLCSSLFWLIQVSSQGNLLEFVSKFVPQQRTMLPAEATLVCIVLMVLQSARRLWESYVFSKRSESRMWVGHYLFGIAFYCCVNIAVWVEGVHAILSSKPRQNSWTALLSKPRIVFGLVAFLVSSLMQSLAHAHLARLQRYSVPHHWLFRHAITPHYAAECAIYLALAIVAAPEEQLFNGSLLWITLLTTVNLGITANGTKTWMIQKFREHQGELQKKFCMLPGVW